MKWKMHSIRANGKQYVVYDHYWIKFWNYNILIFKKCPKFNPYRI